jgi:hypothetical protein
MTTIKLGLKDRGSHRLNLEGKDEGLFFSSPLNPLNGLRKIVMYSVTKYREEKNQVSCKTSKPH